MASASGGNVVEIVVQATNATGAGFAEAQAGAQGAAAGMDEYAAATDRATAAEDAFRAAQAQMDAAQAELDGLQQSGVATTDELAAAQERATAATLASADAQLKLGQADLQVSAAAGKAAAAEKEAAAAAAEAGTAAKDAGTAQEEMGAKQEATATELAGLWAKASLAILGVGAAMVYGAVKAASFQSDMETLHTQAGVAQSQLSSLGSGVLALAGQVGFAPNSLAEALFHIESSFASVGITGPQALNMLKTAAEGAAVGHANLVDVTNALDATIASGIPVVGGMSGAMGALNAIVGAGDMKMQDLANAMGTGIMAVAKSYGQNINEVGAALAMFGDNNIRGAKAATDLRMAWQAIQAPIAAGKTALASIGLTMTSLSKTMTQHGMTAAIQEFVDHLKASKVPAQDWGQMVTEIFGKKAGVGIGVMVDQLDRLKSKFPDLEKGASGFGDAWAKQQQTVSQQWKDLQAGMQALAINLGSAFLPVAQKIVVALTAVANWLNQNKVAAYALTGVIAALMAAFTVSKIADAVTAIKELTLWQNLGAAAAKVAAAAQFLFDAAMDANPVMLVVIAIAALIAGIIYAYTHFKTFRDAVNDVGNALKDAVTP